MTYKLSYDLARAAALIEPARLWRCDELVADWRAVPAASGVYTVWIDVKLSTIGPASHQCEGFGLSYVGIAGGSGNGTLRRRLRQHLRGRCASSTLRRALAALLLDELGFDVALSPAGKVRLLGDGETNLSTWLADHARVCWVEHPDPRALECILLKALAPPLNVDGAPNAAALRAARERLRERANDRG